MSAYGLKPSFPERHFIIGSGPSLNLVDLSMLNGSITWAMNRIHLLYDRTDWRPSFFFMVDFNQRNPVGYWKDCIRAHWNTPKYLWRGFRDGDKMFPDLGEGIGEVPNTTWIDRCKWHHYYMGDNYRKRAQSWHLPDVCTAFSGLGAMMQLAVLHGATELALLGCDLYGPDYGTNHFIPHYSDDDRDRSELDNTNMIWMHQVAKASCPVPIVNASPISRLDVHPKVKLEELLCPSPQKSSTPRQRKRISGKS